MSFSCLEDYMNARPFCPPASCTLKSTLCIHHLLLHVTQWPEKASISVTSFWTTAVFQRPLAGADLEFADFLSSYQKPEVPS